MLDINMFKSYIQEQSKSYTFPISLHPERGWVYGMKGGRTMEITSQHPPEKFGVEVAEGHPHHMEILSGIMRKNKK